MKPLFRIRPGRGLFASGGSVTDTLLQIGSVLLGAVLSIVNGFFMFQLKKISDEIRDIHSSRESCKVQQAVSIAAVNRELQEYKLYVAEKYITANSLAVTIGKFVGEAEKIRKVIERRVDGGGTGGI